MSPKYTALLIVGLALLLLAAGGTARAQAPAPPPQPTPQEQLGKALFFDTNLSEPPGQSCAVCHGPTVGYTGPDQAINQGGAVYEGAVAGRFGNRKPPAAAYAGNSPLLTFDGGKWVGGMFWDGRATGDRLGDPLAEQAQGPFLNPLEQNLPNAAAVIATCPSFELCGPLWGGLPWVGHRCTVRLRRPRHRRLRALRRGQSLHVQVRLLPEGAGQADGTGAAGDGAVLWQGAVRQLPQRAGLHRLHLRQPGRPAQPGQPVLQRAASGTPRARPGWTRGWAAILQAAGYPEAVYAAEWGKQKVPTLRNVALAPEKRFVKAYSHNGYFKSLEEIVHFYNTRDVTRAGWPPPEVAANVNTAEMGNLGLNRGEELAIVAFLATLSDGYTPK